MGRVEQRLLACCCAIFLCSAPTAVGVEQLAQLNDWDGCGFEGHTYTLDDDDVSSEGTSTAEDDQFTVTHPPTARMHCHGPEINFMEQEPLQCSSGGAGMQVTETAVVQYPNDIDPTPVVEATARITLGLSPHDKLAYTGDNGALSASYDPHHGRLTISGEGSVAEYTEALRTIEFSTKADFECHARKIKFVVTDSAGFQSTDVQHRGVSATPFVPAVRTLAVCASIAPPSSPPTSLPTKSPTRCDTYCCDNQVVIWAVPASPAKVCATGFPTTATSFLECQQSCVTSESCGYFAYNEEGGCQLADYGSKCNLAENLLDAPENAQGVYMLFCSVENSADSTCDNVKLPDSGRSAVAEDRTLTNCYERCFEDEERDHDCAYFAYHEHTQECELFPACPQFVDAPELSQSLVYMMHDEAWGIVVADQASGSSSSSRRKLAGSSSSSSSSSSSKAVCTELCGTHMPTPAPTSTDAPSMLPTFAPSATPTFDPTQTPTLTPSLSPTKTTAAPTGAPSSFAPSLDDMEPSPVQYTSGGDAVQLTATTRVADRNSLPTFGGDATPLHSATIKVTDGFRAGDLLTAGPAAAASRFERTYDAKSGVLLISGKGSAAEYEALLQSVSFHAAESSSDSRREVTFLVMDDGLVSNKVVREISVCASVCDQYCCDHQLVIWALPLSTDMVCKGSTPTADASFDACQDSCVASRSCGFFSFDDGGQCQHADFDTDCEHSGKLEEVSAGNSQGVFMLFCSVDGTTGMSCAEEALADSGRSEKRKHRTLTNCYERCFEDEERDHDCAYFAYHEHTQECELFPACPQFVDAPELSQSLVYMMHDEAWKRSREHAACSVVLGESLESEAAVSLISETGEVELEEVMALRARDEAGTTGHQHGLRGEGRSSEGVATMTLVIATVLGVAAVAAAGVIRWRRQGRPALQQAAATTATVGAVPVLPAAAGAGTGAVGRAAAVGGARPLALL